MVFEIENYTSLKSAVEELCNVLSSSDIPTDRIFDSKLVAYELLGNVLKHSGGSAKLHLWIKESELELKVLSTCAFCPPEKGKCADVYAENGRGLYLVDSVSAERICTEDGGILVRIKIK